MSGDNNLNNENNSGNNYRKDQSNGDNQSDEGYQRNEDTGEYRINKKLDSDYDYNYNNNKPSKGRSIWRLVLKAVAFGLIVAVTFIVTNQIFYAINPDLNNGNGFLAEDDEDKFTIEQTKIIEDNIADTDVTQVAETTMPSVVTITGMFTETYNFFGQQIDEEQAGGGSGIIIDQNETELLIATNNHVVEGANPIEVTFINGESTEAIIKGTDVTADLAVIAVDINELNEETRNAIEIAKVLDEGEVKVGEKVVAIGNALGIGPSVTVGYVSALDREVDVNGNVMTLLQTDAAINPGNSGGALLNMNGEVIGINTVKFVEDKVEGMGYAIPIYRAMPILNELKSREIIPEAEQGYLGVSIRDVTEDIAETFNWPLGVYVGEVVDGGPADEAGILQGDIIVGMDDIDITSMTQLIEKTTSYRAGTEVTIRLMRNQGGTYEELEVKAILGSSQTNR